MLLNCQIVTALFFGFSRVWRCGDAGYSFCPSTALGDGGRGTASLRHTNSWVKESSKERDRFVNYLEYLVKKKKKANKQKTSQGKEFPPWCGGLRIRRCLSYSLGCNSDLNSIPGPGNFHMPECNQTKQSKTNPQTNKQTTNQRTWSRYSAVATREHLSILFCVIISALKKE